ncbi:uroporphyrin-III C-methyltransferase / precorrin-2 dehydrogenase / sirohydrochlorin ferrochelatase [Frankineae bacterium MT45]|nr:uroporphyrin-III C-methyltransferase / precorrin-2 dehydrogenase / sirohydrochlorin ferrochelatase [Frankineae bacterium MT45]
MTVTDFPLLLDLADRRVLVVGGGVVAARRVRRLLEAGARVELVAPEVVAELSAQAGPQLSIATRTFIPADIDGAWLVCACTDDARTNEAVASAAEHARVFCIRSDHAPGGSARTPAVLRRGEVTVAITSGDDPQRSLALRDAIALAIDLGSLESRPVRAAKQGSVALVGGGPGHPELITVRGRRLVSEADVVVVDRLAPRELLTDLPDHVEIIDCGKSAHRHNLTQAQINEILIARAQAGKRVVRLKGGDPFVFGRGSEEMLACIAAGVAVSVVPGISSALAAPAAAEIPLTHRGVAADFAVVSGHLDPASGSKGFDWATLATGPATIVMLMAMEHLADISDALIRHGRSADTPAAAIHRATLAGQQTVRSTLGGLAPAVRAAGLTAPSVVIVGEVVDIFAPAD